MSRKVGRPKTREPGKEYRIRITVPHSHLHMMNQILVTTGQSQRSFCSYAAMKEIDRLSEELLGVTPGGPAADYHRLYGYWTVTRALKANWTHHEPDMDIVQNALSQYGEEIIIQAIDTYAEIVHSPDKYQWYPISRMEDWLQGDIKLFLPSTYPPARDRYALPQARLRDTGQHKVKDSKDTCTWWE